MYIIALLLTNLYCKGPQKMLINLLNKQTTTNYKQGTNKQLVNMYIIALLLTNLYCKGPQKMLNKLAVQNTILKKQTILLVGTPSLVLIVLL